MSSLIRRIQRMPYRKTRGAIKRMNRDGFGNKVKVKVNEEENLMAKNILAADEQARALTNTKDMERG